MFEQKITGIQGLSIKFRIDIWSTTNYKRWKKKMSEFRTFFQKEALTPD